MKDTKEDSFLALNQKFMESLGFWAEEDKWMTKHKMMLGYSKDVIREWIIVDFTVANDKTLVKWEKRYRPLTNEELKDKYGV